MNNKAYRLFRSGLSLLLALCLILGTPIAALAAEEPLVKKENCPAERAVNYGTMSKKVVNLIVELAIDGEYASAFEMARKMGMKDMAIGIIEGQLEGEDIDRLMVEFGMEPTPANKTKLANEIWDVAVIYADKMGTSRTDAEKASMLEVLRFALVEVEGLSNDNAKTMAPKYYEVYEIGLKNVGDAYTKAATFLEVPHDATKLVEGKPATCTENGTKAYYVCTKCDSGKYFSDAKGKTEIKAPEVIPAAHTPVLVKGQAATCDKDGTKDHYKCSACGKLFADEAAKNAIEAPEVIPAAHTPVLVAEVPAKCEEAGTKAHYKCACGKLFSDEAGKTVIEAPEAIPAIGHKYTAVAQVEPTCAKPGVKAHFACVCGLLSLTEDGAEKVEAKDLAIDKLPHKTPLKAVEAVAGNCTTAGMKAHFTCEDCNTLFLDAEGKEETTAEALKTSDGTHTYPEQPEWAWSKDYTTATASLKCSVCKEAIEAKAAVTAAVVTKPTCTTAGKNSHTAKATLNGKEYTNTVEEDVAATGHKYAASAWMWAEDNTTASVSLKCAVCADTKVETAKVTSVVTDAGCETALVTTYTATAKLGDQEFTDTKKVTGKDLGGHTYGDVVWTWSEDLSAATASKTCSVCEKSVEAKATITTVVDAKATCTEDGKATLTAKAVLEETEYISVKTQVLPAAHDYKDGVCTVCKKEQVTVFRISGKNRFQTSIKAADALKAALKVEKFENIVVASGLNFADALSGSYLATVKNAPILLVDKDSGAAVQDYILKNLAETGTVYILGGDAAVYKDFEKGLKDVSTKRLKGKTRYETNLEILKAAGVAKDDILVCTGNSFADSLSASALGKPILLVDAKLSATQKEFLTTLNKANTFYVIGGTGAVSANMAEEIKAFGTSVKRIGGKTRYETSVLLADRFLEKPTTAVLAYAWNAPDGLCGGPLANALGAPLILTQTGDEAAAISYAKEYKISAGCVLGGEKLISDASVRNIFGLSKTAPIVKN